MSSSGVENLVDSKDPPAGLPLLDSSRSGDDDSHSPIAARAPTEEEYKAALIRVRKERKRQAIQRGIEAFVDMFRHADDVEEQADIFRHAIGQLRIQMPK